MKGGSFTGVIRTRFTAETLPPRPSSKLKLTAREFVVGLSETLEKAMARQSAWAERGLEFVVVKLITSGLLPLAPPLKEPMMAPPNKTLLPLVLICPAATPWLTMVRRSEIVPLVAMATTNDPP